MNGKLEVLEQTSLPRIIVHLHGVGKASITDLRHDIRACQSAIYKALALLKKNGLIAEERVPGFSRRRDFKLTEKGLEVAGILIELQKALMEQQKDSKRKRRTRR